MRLFPRPLRTLRIPSSVLRLYTGFIWCKAARVESSLLVSGTTPFPMIRKFCVYCAPLCSRRNLRALMLMYKRKVYLIWRYWFPPHTTRSLADNATPPTAEYHRALKESSPTIHRRSSKLPIPPLRANHGLVSSANTHLTLSIFETLIFRGIVEALLHT